MRILFYINQLSDGGAERVIANLANHCADNGDYVVVVNSFATEKEYALDERVKHIYLDNNQHDNFFKRNYNRIHMLRQIIREEKPDVAVSFLKAAIYRLLVASKGLPVKTVVSVRNDPAVSYSSTINRILTKTLFKRADGYVFQTKSARDWFGPEIGKRSRIILNPVKPEFFDVEHDVNGRNVVTLGRLAPEKNHEMLIRAFADIRDEVSDNLLIYGDGPLREHLQAVIEELKMANRVTLMGNTTDAMGVLKSAGVFVLSSDFEGMPNALMEALASGTPSISTACPCGGPEVLIQSGFNGILVPVGDQKAMSDAMREMLCDPKKREEFSRNAKDASQNFRPECIYKQWDDFFNAVAER